MRLNTYKCYIQNPLSGYYFLYQIFNMTFYTFYKVDSILLFIYLLRRWNMFAGSLKWKKKKKSIEK